MLTLNDGRSELWQWDTGRTLAVDADCSQVHFSNKVFGRSIDVDVADDVATIPDILLQTDKDLNVWAFVGTAENGYTKISKTFKVNRRNKPADYVFTPPDQTSLEEIKKEIEYLKSIQDPDAIKNAVENYLEQNPVESPVQSVNGKIGKVELTAEDVGAISQDDLQEATNEALAQAKESGDFDGDDYVLTDDDKTEIAELAAGLVKVPEAPEISMQPLTFTGAVEATYDGSKAVNVEIPSGGEESVIPVETVLAEGTVASGASSWGSHNTGVSIATLNQYKRIRLAIKGASNANNYWAFLFGAEGTHGTNGCNRIANASGMAVVLRKINDGYFRVESIESRGTDTTLKGMVTNADSWLAVRLGSITPVILDLTSFGSDTPLLIAPVNATTIDYSWAVCGYNC